jgi:membrane protein
MTQATTPSRTRRDGAPRPGHDGRSTDHSAPRSSYGTSAAGAGPEARPEERDDAPGGAARLVERIKRLQAWWKTTRPARALAQYGVQRGALLCGGMAYSALFSLFAGLTIFYTAFMAFLGNRDELREAVFDQIDKAVPGLIDTGDGSRGILEPDQLILKSGFDLPSIIAVVVLLFSAISFMAALRTSTRAMFSLTDVGQNPVLSKLRELGGFALLGLAVVISAAATVVVQTLGSTLFGDGMLAAVLVPVVGIAVGLVFDALVVLLIIRFVAGVRPPHKDLYIGALTAAAAFGVLRYLGTSVIVGSSSRNALLGSFATFVTILLLANFVTRILLMVAAWIADPPPQPTPDELREHAEAEHEARLAREVRHGAGYGYPWSPVVRGIRRGRAPRASAGR